MSTGDVDQLDELRDRHRDAGCAGERLVRLGVGDGHDDLAEAIADVLDGARQHGEHDIVANDGAVRLVEEEGHDVATQMSLDGVEEPALCHDEDKCLLLLLIDEHRHEEWLL